MADIYTTISAPYGASFGLNGRHDRAEAVRAAREHFEHQLAQIQAFLALSDAELDVRVVRGWNAPHVLAVL